MSPLLASVRPRLALLLVLLSALAPHVSTRQSVCPGCRRLAVAGNASVAYVANASDPAAASIKVPITTLKDALLDTNVTTIILLTNYSVAEFATHADEHDAVNLQRNVTLRAPDGLMPLLDFEFMRSVVHMCATCVFHIWHIAIANERRGNGAAIDFFVGVPGSVLKLEDAYRLRLACTSTDSTMELIHREQLRSPRFPLADGTQRQVLSRRDITFQGRTYKDMIWLLDYSYDVPVNFVEGKGMIGGFNMRTINSTRLCATTINATCLKVKAADACVNEAIDQLLAEESKQGGHEQQQQQQGQGATASPGSPWLVAVIVPITVVAGLLAAASLIMWFTCARQRQHRHLPPHDASVTGKSQPSGSETGGSKPFGGGGGGSASGSSKERLLDSEEGGADPFFADDLGEPRNDQGWEVVAVNTSPSVGAVGNAKIHFGRLLGAGSFGRVYKGRWAGREVAIKCIEHDSETSKAVENEVQLMISLDHPNIVKAYHYITYRHTIVMGNGAPSQAVSSSQPITAASPISGASRSRQQREQQKQLQQLQRQLQHELGPRHQWLLDMHLGFSDSDNSSGNNRSLHNSGSSLVSGVPATVVDSSPAVTSTVLSPGQSCSVSVVTGSPGSALLGEGFTRADSGCSSGSALQHFTVVEHPESGSDVFGSGIASRSPKQLATGTASADGQPADQQLSQQQQQQQGAGKGWTLPEADLAARADEAPPVQVSLPPLGDQDQVQQQFLGPGVQPCQQQQQQNALLAVQRQQEQQHEHLQHLVDQRNQQQQLISITVHDAQHPSADVAWSNHSDSPKSAHGGSGHSANGSAGSYPSTGQPLTPNQKVGLQRYLMRQQHLLQTSGMRVRPPAPIPPMPAMNGRQVQGANGSNGGGSSGSDAAAVSSSIGSGPAARRPQDLQRSRTFIVQEYCDLGTFTHYASKTLTNPSDDEQMMALLVLLQDAARGIAALHSNSVVHGDVNARNVLVSSCITAPYGAVAKLADLGLSRVIRQQATHKTTNTVGTLSHMPPELLRHGRMSAAVDIYSFGVMMWEVFTAQPAFRHLHYGQFFECIVLKNMRPKVPEDMPRDYSLLMLSCWATNPADRPTAQRLLELLQMMLQERQELRDEMLYSSSAAAAGALGHIPAAGLGHIPGTGFGVGGLLGGMGGVEGVQDRGCIQRGLGEGVVVLGGEEDGGSSGGSSLHLQG